MKLKGQYDAWFSDVTAHCDYSVPSRIFLGAAAGESRTAYPR